MTNLQEIFNRIQKSKKEQKEIKKSYRDALNNSQEHHKINEELKSLKEKKKQIENAIKDDFQKDFERLDDLKIDIESDKEMLNDIALNKLLKGESVELIDENENKYEPIFVVNFKRSYE